MRIFLWRVVGFPVSYSKQNKRNKTKNSKRAGGQEGRMKEEGMVTVKCKECGRISTWYALLIFKCFVCPYCGSTKYEIVKDKEKDT
jgi:Zn finger protein HypA/HybF involved in hydrogenase expression